MGLREGGCLSADHILQLLQGPDSDNPVGRLGRDCHGFFCLRIYSFSGLGGGFLSDLNLEESREDQFAGTALLDMALDEDGELIEYG